MQFPPARRRTRRLRHAATGSRRERGAALVEFTLVLPLLLLVVFGGITTALAYEHKSEVVHAVRDGARYGATVPREQCDTVANCGNRNWADLIRYVTAQRSDGALTTSQICVALVAGPSGAVYNGHLAGVYTTGTNATFPTTGCFDDGNADRGMRVHVSAVKGGDKINLIVSSLGVTLKSNASVRYEQP